MSFLHRHIFSLLDSLPKEEKYAFIVKKRTTLNGNLLAMLEFLLKQNKKIVLYKHGKCVSHIKNYYKNKIKIYENSLNLYDLATSKYVFISHSPYDGYILNKHKDRKIINLWHGVPFKKIGLEIPNIPQKKLIKTKKEASLIDILISSSQKDREIMASSFGIDINKIKITGLPRYEFLKNNFEITKYIENYIKTIKTNKYLVLYAPTLREKHPDPLDQLTKKELEYIDSFANKNNFIFAFRSHYYEEHHFLEKIKNFKNLILLNHKEFFETNTILKYTDLLVSDFSSIWIDYLLLNKPILGFAKDFKHFIENERGFFYNFEETFPDKFLYNIKELMQEIKNNLGTKKTYNKQLKLFHQFNLDTDFSNNVYKTLFE